MYILGTNGREQSIKARNGLFLRKTLRLQSFLKSKLILRGDNLLRREKTQKVSQDFEKFICKIEHYDQDKELRKF